MKFFTRDWTTGQMTDEQFDAVVPAYWQYVESLDLSAPLRDLAELNPHDGRVLKVEHDPIDRTLHLHLHCGDAQVGYFDVLLIFTGARLPHTDLQNLLPATPPARSEILYDEVDRISPGQFEYRLLLYPAGEVTISFETVTVHRQTKLKSSR